MHIKEDVYMRSGDLKKKKKFEVSELRLPHTRQISYTHLLLYALKERGLTYEKRPTYL